MTHNDPVVQSERAEDDPPTRSTLSTTWRNGIGGIYGIGGI